MQTENNNIIFTVFNKKLIQILGLLTFLSIVMVILFFTVFKPEVIVLGLPFVFLVFVLPIFVYGMRNKIIYRFTKQELQYRGVKPENILWENINSYNIDGNNILLTLKDNTTIPLPLLNFNKEEFEKALNLYIK